MVLDGVLERFVKKSPVTVMARLVMQRALSPEWVDALFEEHRERQYTRELLFSMVVDLIALVALGLRPSLNAAAQAMKELPVSVAALYEKVKRSEPEVVRALVQGSAERLTPVVQPMKEGQEPWAAGYRVRVVDGNHLAASEKRLKPLRGFRGAALPGQSLVVYAPEVGQVVDLLPAEDAHAQERALMGPVLERVQPGELWLADRNFSTSAILRALNEKGAGFIIREHGVSPNPKQEGQAREVGRVETGVVLEQAVWIEEEEEGKRLPLRRIELHLEEPTEEGETLLRLLTNVPAERMNAQQVAGLYRRRWTIESMFGELEAVLQGEVKSLGHPRAALLAFGVAVMAYNVLSVLQAAVEASHQPQVTGIEISTYYIAGEVKSTYGGMMVAVSEEVWEGYDFQSAQQLSDMLLQLARQVEPRTLRKHKRAPKPKKKTKKGYVPGEVARRHVATSRVLKGEEVT